MKLPRRRACVPLVAVAILCPGPGTVCLAEGSWSGGLSATSDYVLRGVSQTDGNPAIQGSLAFESSGGWYSGLWVSSLGHPEWYYPAGTADTEIDVFVGRRFAIDADWSLDLHAVHYVYPGDGDFVEYDYNEAEVSLSYRDLVRASVAWSPDASMITWQGLMRDRTTLAYELVLRRPLRAWLEVVAGAGFRDVAGLDSNGYGYWSLGLTALRGPLSLDLARYGTDADGRDLIGSRLAGGRTVVSLSWSF
jgi:uncharacterized protein (TIGR02001 family)